MFRLPPRGGIASGRGDPGHGDRWHGLLRGLRARCHGCAAGLAHHHGVGRMRVWLILLSIFVSGLLPLAAAHAELPTEDGGLPHAVDEHQAIARPLAVSAIHRLVLASDRARHPAVAPLRERPANRLPFHLKPEGGALPGVVADQARGIRIPVAGRCACAAGPRPPGKQGSGDAKGHPSERCAPGDPGRWQRGGEDNRAGREIGEAHGDRSLLKPGARPRTGTRVADVPGRAGPAAKRDWKHGHPIAEGTPAAGRGFPSPRDDAGPRWRATPYTGADTRPHPLHGGDP